MSGIVILSLRINKGQRNTRFFIDCLSSETVRTMFSSIHFHETKQKFHDVPLYCSALRKMTPVKQKETLETTANASSKTADNVASPVKVASIDSSAKSTAKESTSKPEKVTHQDQPKQIIPVLPEEDRLKSKKKKRKKKCTEKKEKENISINSSKNSFLLSPEHKEQLIMKEFVFSEYSDENGNSSADDEESDGDENFED